MRQFWRTMSCVSLKMTAIHESSAVLVLLTMRGRGIYRLRDCMSTGPPGPFCIIPNCLRYQPAAAHGSGLLSICRHRAAYCSYTIEGEVLEKSELLLCSTGRAMQLQSNPWAWRMSRAPGQGQGPSRFSPTMTLPHIWPQVRQGLTIIFPLPPESDPGSCLRWPVFGHLSRPGLLLLSFEANLLRIFVPISGPIFLHSGREGWCSPDCLQLLLGHGQVPPKFAPVFRPQFQFFPAILSLMPGQSPQ